MIVGNDLIDRSLAPPHPRFFNRITSPDEQSNFSDTILNSHILWAIKESAYKAFKQMDSESPENPRAFQVSPDLNEVCMGGSSLKVSLTVETDYVFASVCPISYQTESQVLSCTVSSQSKVARNAALQVFRRISPNDECSMNIEKHGKIPRLVTENSSHSLSLTHHGSFAAATLLM